MVQSIQALSTVLDNHSDRLQSLEKRIDDLHSESLVNHLQFQKLTKQRIDDLEKENARYREALKFYADSTSWLKQISPTNYSPEPVSLDCGHRAKQALIGK